MAVQHGILIGPGSSGHAIITKTYITDYREHGVFALEHGTTLTMSYNNIVGSAPDAVGIIGILLVDGVTGKLTNNKVSANICEIPNTCGPDFFTQTQAFGILAVDVGTGSIIFNNYLSCNLKFYLTQFSKNNVKISF